MRSSILLAVLLLLAPPGWAKEPDEEQAFQKLLNERYSPEFTERVNAAINRSTKYLLQTQQPDGSWESPHNKAYPLGPTILTVLTLHKAGLARSHPRMRKAWEFIYRQPLTKTYSVSILLMALDAKYAPARDPFDVVETDRYGIVKHREGDDPCALTISKQDRALMRRGVTFLVEQQRAEGNWRYPKGGFDLSNTQYALLGLKSALRCKIKVPAAVWLGALRFLLGWQEAKGPAVALQANEVRGRYRLRWKEKAASRGFRYAKQAQPVTGSMTTAGLSGLVICQGALWESRKFRGPLRAQTRRAIRDAMAWMQVNFDVTRNPRVPAAPKPMSPFLVSSPNHYYYLYGLERAGILTRARYFGEFDWYEDGAEFLIDQQHEDGHWPGPPETTCFGLLFLKRATSHVRVPAITPSR